MAPVGGTDVPLLGYETVFGNKKFMIMDHYGPKSYSNIGTSSGTGDVILASDIGWGGFDKSSPLFNAYSFSGTYIVKAFTSSATTVPALSQGAGASYSKFILQWFTTSAAFGAISTEVTNTTDLSAEIVRLELIGE